MLNHVQPNLDQSFIIVDGNMSLTDLKNKLDLFHFAVITAKDFYIIGQDEINICRAEDQSLPIYQWMEAVNWKPSSVSTIDQLSDDHLNWNRPVIVKDQMVNKIEGIITPTQRVHHITKENSQLSAYFYTLAETINDAVTAVDQEGTVICWNSTAEGTYKIKKEAILGKKIGEHFRSDSIVLHEILKEGRPVRGAYHRPNEDTHVLINASPIKKDNTIIGGVATEHDITRIMRLNEELSSALPMPVYKENPFSAIISVNPEVKQAISMAQKVAHADIPVLITGEKGTGKEMLAQSIHYGGSKSGGPFVSMNCSIIPPDLMEVELFGYQQTSFTNEKSLAQLGKLEQASGGTLYIEEIEHMPLFIQEKLIHYLADHSFSRTGGNEIVSPQTRIITSTSLSLESLMKKEKFNKKLYYYLSVIHIDLPPLRHRTEDIVKLTQQFVKEFCSKYQKPVPDIRSDVMRALINNQWPGNIRELRNVVERFILLNEKNVITADYLPPNLSNSDDLERKKHSFENDPELEELLSSNDEALMIEKALLKTYGNKSAAATLLGISRGTLYNKIKEYGLS
ncbi:sigma-54-dependent Fis family transcriptional regulator [Bacillus sp. 03113]|uniref:sigma-54 interaction domain-containing protein n=1 Tax=Bacillus sp. 03113 TaxID=2578211 RepID=UPI0011438B20|nr:sigma 54-interacting transcriptional regulator [Bacillus sp. 03113]